MKRNVIIYGYILIQLIFTSLLVAVEKEKVYGLIDLVRSSEFIVRGKVIRIETYENEPGRVRSNVYFRIRTCYKGNLTEGQEIVLKMYGGTIGESTFFTIDDAQFENNQESILFLNRALLKDQIKYRFYVTDFKLGKFNIINESGTEFILRDKYASESLEITQNNKTQIISNRNKITVQDFINYLNSFIK